MGLDWSSPACARGGPSFENPPIQSGWCCVQRSEPYLDSIEPRRPPPINCPRPGKRTAPPNPSRPRSRADGVLASTTGPLPGQSCSPGLCLLCLSARIRRCRRLLPPPRLPTIGLPCRCLRLPSSVPDDILHCRLSALALYALFHLHLTPMVFVRFCGPCFWYSSRQTSLVLPSCPCQPSWPSISIPLPSGFVGVRVLVRQAS